MTVDQFEFACHIGDCKLIKRLLSKNIIYPDGLHVACKRGHDDVVKILLADSRIDPTRHHNVAIIDACYYGYIDIVRLLMVDKRINPADLNNMALCCATAFGYIEIMKLLLTDSRVVANLDEAIKIQTYRHLTYPILQMARYSIGGDKYRQSERAIMNS